jgi:hypothetical protein
MSANRAAGKTVGFLNSASPGTDISMLLHFYEGRAGRGAPTRHRSVARVDVPCGHVATKATTTNGQT